ncbi:PREDICTED: uncharacterized protein LOC108563088 [Nicrophorus vespilloides]|uniref:Uncharacterized protein LOC108563088 n=1 Tax=Nicrophorus vespilloides TaxID=110193 RepID=A0ABM1MRF6_NICVS|nr:PREDICTED: uncharacterized protein LOC108563088 [Nicrophorus vespilloides]
MDLLEFPKYLYILTKECVSKLLGFKDVSNILIALFLTISMTPFAVTFFGFWMLFRSLIDALLKMVYKDNYVGLMGGIDTSLIICDNCPQLVAFLEYAGTVEEMERAAIKAVDEAMRSKYEKVFYFQDTFMGYYYYHKGLASASSFVQLCTFEGSERLTKKQLSEHLVDTRKTPFINNGRAMFSLNICTNPIYFDDEPNNKNIYAVSFKFNHCLGDAGCFIKFVSQQIGELKNSEQPKPSNNTNVPTSTILDTIVNSKLLSIPFTDVDKNVLRGYNNRIEVNYIYFNEINPRRFNTLRNIRKKMGNVNLSSIIGACLGRSLHDYYKKVGASIPDVITNGHVISTKIPEIGPMTSSISAVMIKVPIGKFQDNPLVENVKFLQHQFKMIQNTMDIEVSFWLAKFATNLLPDWITKTLLSLIQVTIGLTNFQGPSEFTLFGNGDVKDLIILPDKSPGIAIHILVYTFKSGLHITGTINKSVISDWEKAQEIVDRTIYYLDELGRTCEEADMK